MILDKVLHGVLDQGRGCLLVFDEPEADVSADFSSLVTRPHGKKNTYGAAIATLEQVGKVVESLYAKVRLLVRDRFSKVTLCFFEDCQDYIS